MRQKIEQVIKEKIAPLLQKDGGGIDFIDVTEDLVVKVKLKGACGCCPMSSMTLKNGVEKILKQEIPEIKEVVTV